MKNQNCQCLIAIQFGTLLGFFKTNFNCNSRIEGSRSVKRSSSKARIGIYNFTMSRGLVAEIIAAMGSGFFQGHFRVTYFAQVLPRISGSDPAIPGHLAGMVVYC